MPNARARHDEVLVANRIDLLDAKPAILPRARSSVNVPDRSRPNRKFAPTHTSARAANRSARVSTKSSGSQRDELSVNRTMATASRPARSKASSFWSRVISRGGALSGRRTRGGCGSKIIATDVPARSPRLRAAPRRSAADGRGAARRSSRGPRRVRPLGPRRIGKVHVPAMSTHVSQRPASARRGRASCLSGSRRTVDRVAEIMGDVGEVASDGPDATGHRDGLAEGEMRGVRPVPQRVEHQDSRARRAGPCDDRECRCSR